MDKVTGVSGKTSERYDFASFIFTDKHQSHRIVRSCNISNTRDSVSSGYPKTEKRVENTTRNGIFLTKFEIHFKLIHNAMSNTTDKIFNEK